MNCHLAYVWSGDSSPFFQRFLIIANGLVRLCDVSSHDISAHETFSLHSDPNHNPNPRPNRNPNLYTNPDPNPNLNSAVPVTCLRIQGREMIVLTLMCAHRSINRAVEK